LRSKRGSHWLTFDIKGDYGYVAPIKNSADGTEIFDARTHTSVGVIGSSEDMLEIEFRDGKITQVGDQYGIGRR
jgi:leucyl aminopeptidase (aminopeptidase T)